jgi:hypothetical protein
MNKSKKNQQIFALFLGYALILMSLNPSGFRLKEF